MINVNIDISKQCDDISFYSFVNRSSLLTKHKAWEFEISKESGNIFCFNLSIDFIRKDHAGFYFNIGLLGFVMSASIHDTRHWDYENNCWEIYKD